MSDDPDHPRVVTAPLGVTPAAAPDAPAPVTAKLEPAPANARPATQMSASAVPSTLESPHDPAAPPAALAALENAVTFNAFNPATDEINGAVVVRGEKAAHDGAPLGAEGAVQEKGRVGPATMMSPAVVAPLPGQSTPPLAPEQAVVDVGAPAHAFVPYGGPAGLGGSRGAMHQGNAGPGQRRPMSTTFLALVVGGVVAAVALLAVAVLALVLFTRARNRAADAEEARSTRGPSITVTPAPPEPPRLPSRMGGTKARVSVTSAGALDPEAVRVAVTGALPRLDACFAATELDPPAHETSSFDLDVAPNGEVRRAEPTPSGPRSLKLDACIVQNLRSVRMPKAAKTSTVKLAFFAPIEPR